MGLNNKPKVLIFTDWFEPGYKAGGPIRSIVNLVKSLGHRIDFFVVTGDRDFGDVVPYEGIELGVWIKRKSFTVQYVPSSAFKPTFYWQLLGEQNYNSIYLNSLFSFQFTIVPLLLLRVNNTRSKIILAPRGMLRPEALQIKSKKKALFLSISKFAGLFKHINWHTTSSEEAEEIGAKIKSPINFKIPNISNVNQGDIDFSKQKQSLGCRFVFISRLTYTKNLLFILEVLNQLETINENVIFDIYGPLEDLGYWNKCNVEIKSLESKIKINYKGELSYNKVLNTLKEYHFFLLPTRNENYGHAIVEAGLAGCVPVISDQTPWKNLEGNKAGWDLSLNNKSGFLEVIKYCIEMPNSVYQSLSQSCSTYFLSKVKDEKILEAYYEMFKGDKGE